MEGDPADLAERMANAGEGFGMLLREELRAEVSAGLLVGEHGEHDAAGRHAALCLRSEERRDHHRHARLHVERAASPYDAVGDLGRKRRMRPLLARGRDDVDVAVEEEWRVAVRAGQPRDEVGSLGLARVQLALDSRRREQALHVLDALALVPGGFVVSKRSRSRSSSTGSGMAVKGLRTGRSGLGRTDIRPNPSKSVTP